MVILNDSAAKAIKDRLAYTLESYDGMEDDDTVELREHIKALTPMTDACAECKHEYLAGYEEPCNSCVYGNGLKIGYEAQS